MSVWHGGKGDASRVTSVTTYANNYDKIFKKKMTYKLFLDDYRNPRDATLAELGFGVKLLEKTQTREFDWTVVRSYDEFVNIISKRGIPELVSFDNDLNNLHMQAYFESARTEEYNWKALSKTGIHCVLFLLDECKRRNMTFPPYYVHSVNHFARKIIPEIINEYQRS